MELASKFLRNFEDFDGNRLSLHVTQETWSAFTLIEARFGDESRGIFASRTRTSD